MSYTMRTKGYYINRIKLLMERDPVANNNIIKALKREYRKRFGENIEI